VHPIVILKLAIEIYRFDPFTPAKLKYYNAPMVDIQHMPPESHAETRSIN